MTKLEAVNIMLGSIGESPIASLDSTGSAYVAIAKSVLDEVSRDVQSEGWHFNTSFKYSLARDVNGKIPVPSNALKVDTNDYHGEYNVTVRSGYLYDLEDHTDVFTEALYCDIVFGFDFEDLPQVARRYIALRAARTFASRVLGDADIYKFISAEESDAKASFESTESFNADLTMLNASWDVYRVIER
jgi:hypothetical protein